MLASMGAMLFVALAVPGAFGDDAVLFGAAYLLVRLLHLILSAIVGQGAAYSWLLNMSGLCGFIVWAGIAVSHYRFRRGFLAQGNKVSDLPYKASLFPIGPLLAFALLSMSLILAGGCSGGGWSWPCYCRSCTSPRSRSD